MSLPEASPLCITGKENVNPSLMQPRSSLQISMSSVKAFTWSAMKSNSCDRETLFNEYCKFTYRYLTKFAKEYNIIKCHYYIWNGKCIQISTNMPGIGSLIREIKFKN